MKKYIVTFLIIAIAVAIGGLIIWNKSADRADNVKTKPAQVKDLKGISELCTMEIYEDVPIKGHVGTRHLFARMTMRGSISFDLEKMTVDYSGDTVKAYLPKEKISLLESTAPNSYEVIDTWNDRFLGSGNITTKEENRMKELTAAQFENRIRRKGYVKRARSEASANIESILSAITKRPVMVIDTIR